MGRLPGELLRQPKQTYARYIRRPDKDNHLARIIHDCSVLYKIEGDSIARYLQSLERGQVHLYLPYTRLPIEQTLISRRSNKPILYVSSDRLVFLQCVYLLSGALESKYVCSVWAGQLLLQLERLTFSIQRRQNTEVATAIVNVVSLTNSVRF